MIDKKENSSMKLLDVDFHALNEEQLKHVLTKVELISILSMQKTLHESHLLDFILFFMSTFILLILMNVYDVSKTVIAISFLIVNIYYFLSAYRKLKNVNKKQIEENSCLNEYIHENLIKK